MKKIKNNRCGYQKHWVAVPGIKNGGFCRRNPNAPASLAQETHTTPHSADLLKAIGISAGTLAIAGVGFGAAMLLTQKGREKAVADANMAAVHEATAKVAAEYEAKLKDLADRHQKDLETASKAPAPTTPPTTPVSPVDEAKTAELEKNLAAARAAHEELSQQHDRLKGEANTLKETLAKAEASHERTRSELDKATAALASHQKEIDFLRSRAGESEDLQKRLEVVQRDRDALAEAVAQHGRDLQSNAETIETLNQTLEKHKATIAGLATERETLTGQIKANEETIAKAKAHIAGLHRTLRGHQATIEGQGQVIIERTAERDAGAKTIAALQDKLNESKARHEELSRSFEQQLSARESKIKEQYENQREALAIDQENAIQDEIERLRKQKVTEIAQIRAEAEKAIANAERYSAVQYGKIKGNLVDHSPSGAIQTNGGIQFAASVRQNQYPIDTVTIDKFSNDVMRRTSSLLDGLKDNVIVDGTSSTPSVHKVLIDHIIKEPSLSVDGINTAFDQTDARRQALTDIVRTVKQKAIEDSVSAAQSFYHSYSVSTIQSDRDKLIDKLDKVFRQIYQRSRKQIYESHTRVMNSGQYSLRGVLGSDGEPVTQPAFGVRRSQRIKGDSYMSNYLSLLK